MPLQTELASLASTIGVDVGKLLTIAYPLGGQFLLDPNEINGWGGTGPIDNTNSQDLGNVGVANFNRLAGGFCFPFDVQVKRLYVHHRNNNANAQAWGWVIGHSVKTPPGNGITTTYVLDEVADNAGVGPRDYGNNQNQLTDIDLSAAANNNVPSGSILTLAVAAPTAVGTNYYVQIASGYIELERVL
ncbi:MAG: hypothetical protein AAGJ40_09650 [Planctomycetota bacterium]